MSIVGFVLRRPYTVAAVLTLICLLGIGAARRMPVDIFPAEDIQNRILSAGSASVSAMGTSRMQTVSMNGQVAGPG
jgi:hypothetical protein